MSKGRSDVCLTGFDDFSAHYQGCAVPQRGQQTEVVTLALNPWPQTQE